MIGFFFRYVFSISKLNREPEQHELAQLFIDYAEGRKHWQALFDFLEPRQWLRRPSMPERQRSMIPAYA
jgi:hypothetical protein